MPEIKKKIRARTTTIEDLDLSVRTYGRLKHAGIDTVEDLTSMTWDRFIRIRNLGKKSGDEVFLKLEQLGFALKLLKNSINTKRRKSHVAISAVLISIYLNERGVWDSGRTQ